MRLRELRLARKMLQRDVAKLLNVSRSSYSLYEIEKIMPPIDALATLADFYGVTIDYLLGRPEAPASALCLSETERMLVLDFRQLNPQGREYVLQSLDMALKIYRQSPDLSDVEDQEVGVK